MFPIDKLNYKHLSVLFLLLLNTVNTPINSDIQLQILQQKDCSDSVTIYISMKNTILKTNFLPLIIQREFPSRLGFTQIVQL